MYSFNRFLLVACVMAMTATVVSALDSLSEQQAIQNIKSYLDSIKDESITAAEEKLQAGATLCAKNTCCNLSDNESCDMTSLAAKQSTLILPGGKTRCIFDASTPYAFQVYPGATDKLLINFQGGGACWDKFSTDLGLCTTSVSPVSESGMFDRSRSDNKFADYTVISLLYCSGDVWGGNVTQSFTYHGSSVVQTGLENTQATLDWIVEQQSNGGLSDVLSELILTGTSAGSLGVQIWATTMLESLKWKQASVLPDSYVGIFPDGTEGPLMYSYGICLWDKLPSVLVPSCLAQTLTMEESNQYFFKQYQNVPFSFIQSKVDAVQQSFYVAIAISMNVSAIITPTIFYEDVNKVFANYNKYNPNFLTYLVDGDQHGFVFQSSYYSADGLGPKDNNSPANTGEVLYVWSSHYPMSAGDAISTLCLGTVDGTDDNTYCSSQVFPKTYTESV